MQTTNVLSQMGNNSAVLKIQLLVSSEASGLQTNLQSVQTFFGLGFRASATSRVL